MHPRHALLLLACLGFTTAAAEEPALRAGVLDNALPFVTNDGHGNLSGFTIELFRAIAERMQRPITFTTASQPELTEGLKKNTYDLLAGPVNATPDSAASLLLTEGYLWSEFQFGNRTGEPVNDLKDLKGRRLAVRADSPYAEWANRNAQHYGFTTLPTKSGIDAVHAVLDHQADASLSASPLQAYAAWHEKGYAAGLSLPETRTHESAAVRRDNTELRDELEDALRCLKLNGTVAKLSKTWFGHEPDAEDLENLVVPGYGVPGLAGYDPKPRKARC